MDSSLLSRRDALLRGVDSSWLPLIDFAMLDHALDAIDKKGDAAFIAPPPELVFEALRYGTPADVTAVIVGQDPYPTLGDAQGLCFSVPKGTPIPCALRRVFGCLERAGLRRAGAGAPDTGDLRSWAAQGVLMLNASLTTRSAVRRAHAAAWKPFVDELVRRLCAERRVAGVRLHFLLWGGDARSFAACVREHDHKALEWSHPSPLADNKLPAPSRFRECPHFEEVNAALAAAGRRPINWDSGAACVAFTDGSCPLNGKPDARAAFAALVTGGQFGATVLRGEVRPTEYAFVDPDDPLLGVRGASDTSPIAPSNNRGELLGIIYALLALLRGRATGPVEIVSDSKICVKTLLEWLPTRLAKGTERELKNFDLVAIAWRLLGLLRAQAASVALTHVHSHQKAPPSTAPARERLLHRGNAIADEHAAKALATEGPPYELEIFDAPAGLRALASH